MTNKCEKCSCLVKCDKTFSTYTISKIQYLKCNLCLHSFPGCQSHRELIGWGAASRVMGKKVMGK